MSIRFSCRPLIRRGRQTGFSLLEVLVALALGLLLMAGIITLFSGISGTNKVQNGLARLQENGRFALMRMEADLHMAGAQYCSTTTGASAQGAMIPVMPPRAPMVYAKDLKLPDSNIKSINASGNPATSLATAAYTLSPRWFMQGYSCTTTGCTPTLTEATTRGGGSTGIPDMALADGARVPGSDVLTVRYQRGSGWTIRANSCTVTPAGSMTGGAVMEVSPQPGDDDFDDAFATVPELVLVTDCISPAIFPISAVNVASRKLTVSADILPGITGALCNGSQLRDTRLFDFSRDFVTVSFYLVFREDDSPDARPNSAAAKRLIPVLVRRENGTEQELVRGVDLLAFQYGVKLLSGETRYMTAAQIEGAGTSNCGPPPEGMAIEPGCLWRSVRTIEPHLLVNSVDEVASIGPEGRRYRFNGTSVPADVDDPPPAATDTLASGLQLGNMNRREFVGLFSVRNGNQ